MITIVTAPSKYQPGNAAIFKVSSDRDAILQFKVTIFDQATDEVMSTQKYATLPMFPTGTTFDLAPLILSFVDFELNTQDGIIAQVTKPFRCYYIQVLELYRDADTQEIVEGDSLFSPDNYYLWLAQIDTVSFNNYNSERYVPTPAGVPSIFLNNKPLSVKTYYDSVQYLYFMTSIVSKVVIKCYRRPNILTATKYIGVTENKMYRVDVSPASLFEEYGPDLFRLESEFTDPFDPPFGSPDNAEDSAYYTVEIQDESGNTLSEVRTYIFVHKPCIDTLDLVFSNDLGGYDSAVFRPYKQSVTVQRGNIEANPWQLDSTGNLLRAINGIFNPSSAIISVTKDSTFSIVSDVLNDEYSYYLKDIVESKNVLVRLSTGDMFPIEIQETTYDINKRKYNTNNGRATLNFKIHDTALKLI
jgi:hypothetical protein